MKEKLLGFFEALRSEGIVGGVSESIDAFNAVLAVGVERERLRQALCATLLKNHADQPVFDVVFDRYFGSPGRKRGKSTQPRTTSEGIGAGRGDEEGRGRAPRDAQGERGERERREAEKGELERTSREAERLARRQALMSMPFRDMTARDIEEARELVEEISRRWRARRSRRIARASRGRLDLRRTFRRSMSRGGVPVELLFRRPRPGKSDLVALIDVSFSAATAAEFLLSLLGSSHRFFRHVLQLAYVDDLTEISFVHGHVVPHGPLDLNARSDFGNVLRRFRERYEHSLGRNTVLLVLGDARNNRRPPRADLLARLRRQVRAAVWLNPELKQRWNTGDSVIARYKKHVDVVLAAANLRELAAALDAI